MNLTFFAKNIGERIKQIRLDHKMLKSEFADTLGWKRASLTYYERGQHIPKVPELIKLFEQYFVNLHWLITGEGNIYQTKPEWFITTEDNIIRDQKVEYKTPTDDMKLLMERILQMSRPRRILLLKLFDTFIDIIESIQNQE